MDEAPIKSQADRDRLRGRIAARRKADRILADVTASLLVDWLNGRPGDECMTELARKAKEFGR
jgi:hypothetical protein